MDEAEKLYRRPERMRKIDRETVQRILETADIVDVVSDFVSLKRRGSGYIGQL